MRDFKELAIWKRSHKLTLEIYLLTRNFPKEETFGQVSQIRRAVASIPTNIAEGCGRQTIAEFLNFLNIASGSASEVEYELLLAKDLGYMTNEQYMYMSQEVRSIRSMLSAYMAKLQETNINQKLESKSKTK